MIQQIDLYSKDFDIYALGEKMNEIIDLLNEKEQTEVNKLALGDVIKSVYCECENQTKYTDANGKTYCKWCGKDIKQ